MSTLTAITASALAAGVVAMPAGAQRPAGPAGLDVWFDGGNSFDRGALAPLRFSADPGTHVAIVRVDGDGRFSVLWPTSPNSRSNWQGGPGATTLPFRADETDGVGYVFAIASRAPFDFRQFRTSSGHWMVGRLASAIGADPFELADRFARAVTDRQGDYSIAYAPYQTGSGDYHVRSANGSAYGERGGAVYAPDDAYGSDAYSGYGDYGGYDVGILYADPWGTSRYRRRYTDYRYPAFPYSADPRMRYMRHCPDGILAPYTTPCLPAFRGRGREGRDGRTGQIDRSRDDRFNDRFSDGFNDRFHNRFDDNRFRNGFDPFAGGVIRGMAGARDGGRRLEEGRRRFSGRVQVRPPHGSPRTPPSMPHPVPGHGRP